MTTDRINSIADLEACIGAPGLPVKMKIIDHLDRLAARWIDASPIAFVAFGGPDGPNVSLAGGAPGFATVKDKTTLRVKREAIDDAGAAEVGRGAGVLFLAPGVGETLRANGRVARVDDEAIEIRIEECFVHCAKALIRSDFWDSAVVAGPADGPDFVGAARFLALATMDAEGRIDLSPKGDPAGLLTRMTGDTVVLAERPGNRLAFGYRNMIEQPAVAVLGLIPGAAATVGFTGRAHLSTSEALRATFVVDGKTPLMATVIEGARPEVRPSPALTRAALWPTTEVKVPIDPSETLVAHLKLNKAKGPAATLLRLSATRGIVEKGLKSNYQTDLY